jgi:deoxyribose-phosphate aldolase
VAAPRDPPAFPGREPVPPERIREPRDLAPLVDHTLLRPGASAAEVERACAEALRYGFAGVCVRREHVARVAAALRGSRVLPVAVVDFPLGEGSTAARAREAAEAVLAGAAEIDALAPLPALLALDHRGVLDDLREVVGVARPAAVKVILETCRLGPEQKAAGAALAAAAGAAYVKTSTGFGAGGATEEDVRLLRAAVGRGVGVKASGGIRTAGAALRMVRAGASRIGCSASVAIVEAGSFD